MYLYNTTAITAHDLNNLSDRERNAMYYAQRKRKKVNIDETKNTQSIFIS
jgi:hypothetical protein